MCVEAHYAAYNEYNELLTHTVSVPQRLFMQAGNWPDSDATSRMWNLILALSQQTAAWSCCRAAALLL